MIRFLKRRRICLALTSFLVSWSKSTALSNDTPSTNSVVSICLVDNSGMTSGTIKSGSSLRTFLNHKTNEEKLGSSLVVVVGSTGHCLHQRSCTVHSASSPKKRAFMLKPGSVLTRWDWAVFKTISSYHIKGYWGAHMLFGISLPVSFLTQILTQLYRFL